MAICCGNDKSFGMTHPQQPKTREDVEQDQFLSVLSREEALARFEAALFPRALQNETRPPADGLRGGVAEEVAARMDVRRFGGANVDGFGVPAADLAQAGEATPVRLALTAEII